MRRVFFSNQKRGGTTLRSNVYRLLASREQAPRAQYPLTIRTTQELSFRLTKNSLSLTKNRFVSLHFQKRKMENGKLLVVEDME